MIGIPVHHAPLPKRDLGRKDAIDMLNQRGCAVTELSVVKPWMGRKRGGAFQKTHQQFCRILWSTICPEEVNFFVLVICADTTHFPFVTSNQQAFQMPPKFA